MHLNQILFQVFRLSVRAAAGRRGVVSAGFSNIRFIYTHPRFELVDNFFRFCRRLAGTGMGISD